MDLKSKILVLVCVSLILSSCTHTKQSPTINASYIVVGSVGGFTVPSSTVFYMIGNGQIKADTSVPYGYTPANTDSLHFTITLPTSKYDSVAGLLSSIPSELLSRNNTHIGSIVPDMGYYWTLASVNGTVYRWGFEGNQAASSPAIQQFVNSLQVVFR